MKTIYISIRVTAFVAFMVAALSVVIDGNLMRTLALLVSVLIAVCGVLFTCLCDAVVEREHLNYLQAHYSPKHLQITTDIMRADISRERLTLLVTYMFALFVHFVIIHFDLLEKLS